MPDLASVVAVAAHSPPSLLVLDFVVVPLIVVAPDGCCF